VLRIERTTGFFDGNAWKRGWHHEQRALIERRHELRPEPQKDRHRGNDDDGGRYRHEPSSAHVSAGRQ